MGNNTFYSNQVITYLGNKRLLLSKIEMIVQQIIRNNYPNVRREEIIMADFFSGSGIVSRMLKTYAGTLYVNDFEPYTKIINECFLTNKNDFNEERFDELMAMIKSYRKIYSGKIRRHYSPKDERNITQEDRCFYTNRNAVLIDTYRVAINRLVEEPMRKFFLASLLYEASVHVNTGGYFKGFYKDKVSKIGKFGGTNQDALKRILGKIDISKPILSDYDSDVRVFCEDTNELVKKITDIIDIAYIDSPYNQHPYGSNYFMLNTIIDYSKIVPSELSKVSGIPKTWKRSNFYKKSEAGNSMDSLINDLKAKWIIISYSSDGLISKDKFEEILEKYGTFCVYEINYSVLKSGRKRKDSTNKLTEYIFVLKKNSSLKEVQD